MPITVSELIHSSFRLIGAIVAGELLETTELNDAFVSLNQMLMTWNNEGASLVGRKRLLVTVGSFVQIYALPERPVKIDAASVATNNIDCPLELVDAAGWEAIQEKSLSSTFVKKLFCDYLFPNSTVYLWPAPRWAGTLEMWVYATIPQFTALDQVIDLPFGYEAAIRYNFAIALLPEYPRSQIDPTLPAQAQQFRASIVQLNASNQMRSQMQASQQAAATQAAQQVAS